jgi:uncharacterized protein (DUF2249 family)
MALLDVREELQQGKEPFQKIMSAAASLDPGEELEIIAPFEPLPLYSVLGARGFSHQTERTSDGGWRVLFRQRQRKR